MPTNIRRRLGSRRLSRPQLPARRHCHKAHCACGRRVRLPRTLAPRARGRGLRCGGSSPLSGASHNTFLWHRRKTPARADSTARAYASPAADRQPRKPTAVPGRLRSRPAYPAPLAPRPPDPGGRARWSRSAPARRASHGALCAPRSPAFGRGRFPGRRAPRPHASRQTLPMVGRCHAACSALRPLTASLRCA